MPAARSALSAAVSSPLPAAPSGRGADLPNGQPVRRLRFRRIYILPTRQGLGFAAAITVMLLGSINYDNALGYVLCFMLIGVSLVSMLHAVRNLAGLTLSKEPSPAVFAGDHARFALRVDNRAQRQRFGLLARLGPGRRRGAGDWPVAHVHLDADSVTRIALSGVAAQRGWYAPGPVIIATRFPFGLFRAWWRGDIGLRCLVYPRAVGEQPLPESPPEGSGESGERGSGEDEFAGLRDYHQGDSARRIHWKAVAREQGVPVKVFGGASAGIALLRWQDVAERETETCLSQLCRWVLDAEARGLRYGLCLPGMEIAPDSGEEHRRQCLEALALYQAPVPV